jgi:hypothetical protein
MKAQKVMIAGALIEIVHPQTVILRDIMWRKVIAGQVDESLVGCAEKVDHLFSSLFDHQLAV